MSREIRVADAAVKNKDSLRWNPLNKRYAPVTVTKGGDGDDDAVGDDVEDEVTEPVSEKVDLPQTPTKNNPIIVAVYGQICIAAKSYQSAICALLSRLLSNDSDACMFVQSTFSMPMITVLTIL